MLMKVLSANAATSTSAEKISGQTNRQTNKQTREPLGKGDSCTRISIIIEKKINKFTNHSKKIDIVAWGPNDNPCDVTMVKFFHKKCVVLAILIPVNLEMTLVHLEAQLS